MLRESFNQHFHAGEILVLTAGSYSDFHIVECLLVIKDFYAPDVWEQASEPGDFPIMAGNAGVAMQQPWNCAVERLSKAIEVDTDMDCGSKRNPLTCRHPKEPVSVLSALNNVWMACPDCGVKIV